MEEYYGKRRKNSFSFFFIAIIVLSIHICAANAESFTVGDDQKWDSGVDYGVWSQKYNFTTGDVLVFKYLKGQHDAYEVTESTFRSCDTTTGVLHRYVTGNDQITLEEARKYWFICNVAGHCLGGMRFGINVGSKLAGNTDNSTSTGTPASPGAAQPPSPAGSNEGSSRHGSGRWSIVGVSCLLLVFGTLSELLC